MRKRVALVGLLIAAVAIAAVVGFTSRASASHGANLTKITLQLKWVPQAQFAGYYAALDLGYYKAAGLDVKILPGGPQITPEQVVASGRAQFGLDWLPSLLAFRDQKADLVNIAQVFARSGMTQITWKSSGIKTIAQMKHKKVANWLGGNQWDLFAALTKYGINPNSSSDVTIVQEPFSMNFFIQHQVDSASAMTYNELAQVLESKNPQTGKLFTLSDLNVIPFQKVGTAMLEDGIFSTGAWLQSKTNQGVAEKFLGASLAGWICCRDHVSQCVNFTLKAGPTLPKGHQTWMMNEINKLIWPNKGGIGIMQAADFNRTVRIALQFGVIKHKSSATGAYRTDLAKVAVAGLKQQGMDVNGKTYKPIVVHLKAGGK
jgi:NitT/TauT family transport system substrate-binding protein